MSTQAEDKQQQNEAVRRIVGIAALRRLRKMVDADAAQTAENHTRARRLLVVVLMIAVVTLGFLLRGAIFG
jgi:hypothetical protein